MKKTTILLLVVTMMLFALKGSAQQLDSLYTFSRHYNVHQGQGTPAGGMNIYQYRYEGESYIRLYYPFKDHIYDFKPTKVYKSKYYTITEATNKGNRYLIKFRKQCSREQDPCVIILSGETDYNTVTVFYQKDMTSSWLVGKKNAALSSGATN